MHRLGQFDRTSMSYLGCWIPNICALLGTDRPWVLEARLASEKRRPSVSEYVRSVGYPSLLPPSSRHESPQDTPTLSSLAGGLFNTRGVYVLDYSWLCGVCRCQYCVHRIFARWGLSGNPALWATFFGGEFTGPTLDCEGLSIVHVRRCYCPPSSPYVFGKFQLKSRPISM